MPTTKNFVADLLSTGTYRKVLYFYVAVIVELKLWVVVQLLGAKAVIMDKMQDPEHPSKDPQLLD